MQFLPQIFSSNNVSAMGGASPAPRGVAADNPFLDMLNSELAASGVTPVVDVSVNGGTPPGFRTVDRDVSNKLDSDDLLYMRDLLKKRGLDATSLDGIEGPLTIGTIKRHLASPGRKSGELSDEEYTLVSGALAKMGLGQEDIEEIMGMMDAGDADGALQAVRKFLGDTEFVLNKAEVGALARGLDLSGDVTQKMAALFGEEESLTLDKKGFDALFAPAASELAQKKSMTKRLVEELPAIIEEALEAKRKRNVTTPVADTRGSRQSERAETRMVDDLTARGKNALSQREGDIARPRDEREDLAAGPDDGGHDAPAEEDPRKAAVQELVNGANGKKTRGAEEGTSPARDGLSSVFSRVEASSIPGVPVPGMAMPYTPVQPGSAAEHAALARKQDIFSQVEQGMLRQLADGSTKMTLRLDPADLGQVTLLLTVKNGEIRALIRADNPETTTALTEQMAQLRTSLEEQGLKVASLDVETRLQQDTTQQWSDPGQFNQEQDMREQARFSRLARMRREAGEALARDMQSSMRGEEISSSLEGMHIIA